MIKKESVVPLVLVLLLAVIVIGVSIYDQMIMDEDEIIQEEVIEEDMEKPVEVVVEEPEPEKPKEIVINIMRYEFDKPEVVIPVGTKVIWNNTDTRRHMITNKRIGLFRMMRKSLELGDTFEYTFDEPGTYEILEANFGIHALVIVEEENQITGGVIGVSSSSFLVFAINLFLITLIILVVGFYVSKHKSPQ